VSDVVTPADDVERISPAEVNGITAVSTPDAAETVQAVNAVFWPLVIGIGMIPPAAVAALAGATEATVISPAPRADTATSAMRLRSVFIDIFFLSLSQIRSFLIWLEEVF